MVRFATPVALLRTMVVDYLLSGLNTQVVREMQGVRKE